MTHLRRRSDHGEEVPCELLERKGLAAGSAAEKGLLGCSELRCDGRR